MPDKRRRDIDNCAKAMLDLIKRHGLIEDDHSEILRDLRISVVEDFIGTKVEVFPHVRRG